MDFLMTFQFTEIQCNKKLKFSCCDANLYCGESYKFLRKKSKCKQFLLNISITQNCMLLPKKTHKIYFFRFSFISNPLEKYCKGVPLLCCKLVNIYQSSKPLIVLYKSFAVHCIKKHFKCPSITGSSRTVEQKEH